MGGDFNSFYIVVTRKERIIACNRLENDRLAFWWFGCTSTHIALRECALLRVSNIK